MNENAQNDIPETGENSIFIATPEDAKWIRLLPNDEVPSLKELGHAAGPLRVALRSAFDHCPNFFERVVAYRTSEEGMGALMAQVRTEVLGETTMESDEALTYFFYEER